MEWFQSLLNKSSGNKSNNNNNNNSNSSSNGSNNNTENGNNNTNDMNIKESNNNHDNNDVGIKNNNNDYDKSVDGDNGIDNNDNNNATSSIINPKICYTLDALRRIEKRLGKIELPQEISEYVTLGRFRSVSKNQFNADRGGRKQEPRKNQNNNINNNNNNNNSNYNNNNKQGGDNNWSRNRQVPQDNKNNSNNNNNNNNNNTNNNYNNNEKKLSIAEQKLLFEQERRKILAEREKLNDEHDGNEPALQFRDETDLLLEELAGESNESQVSTSKGTKISFNSLLTSSEGDISHQHHAPVDSNGNSVVVQFSSLKIAKEEIPNQSDIWSSFLDPKISPDNMFGESIFNGNRAGNQYGEAVSMSKRKESRLGSILNLAPSPEKSNRLNFDRVDDDTLDLTNPTFFADTLPPSPNSKNNRLNVQSLFSAARQNPNNQSPDSSVEHKIIKSSDVLSRLGFEGHHNNDSSASNNNSPTPPTPSNNSSPFSFHGQDSAVKKGRKQAGGLSVASRMQLMKMQTGKKTENTDKAPMKSEAPPVQTETTPVKAEAIPVKAEESPVPVDGLSNLKRINLNSLFVRPQG